MSFTKYDRRKYAQSLRRIESGVWGYAKSLFYVIHLTTREGDDNSSERFVGDFRKLVKWFRSLGYVLHYCSAMGFTPGKGLVHSHGLLRVKGGFLKLYEGKVVYYKKFGREGYGSIARESEKNW